MKAPLDLRSRLDLVLAAGGVVLAGLVVLGATTTIPSPPRLGGHIDPLDVSALHTRAMDLDLGGGSEASRRLFTFIGHRSWRIVPTQLWLLRDDLIRGDFTGAFQSADALLRMDRDGQLRGSIYPVLIQASAFVEARPSLVARLADNPWWRADFLQHLSLEGEPDGVSEVFADLADTAHPATPIEYAPLINRLVGANDFTAAEQAWNRATKAQTAWSKTQQRLDVAPRWDHTPFSWSIPDGVGATSESVAETGDAKGWSLHVNYDGVSLPNLPSRLVLSRPGKNLLRWRERGDGAGRLFLRARCAETGQVLAQESVSTVEGDRDWRDVEMLFVTPASGCAAQWIELESNPADHPSPVSVWYANFQLSSAP